MDRPTSAAPASTSAAAANRNPAGATGTTATATRGDRRRAVIPAGAPAARGGSILLDHPLRAVSQLLRPQPLVVRQSVAMPPHELVQDPADLLAVEQQFHLVPALLP